MGKKAISILAAVLAVALVVVGILFFQAEQTVSQCRQDQSALIVKIGELNDDMADRDSQIEALNAEAADKDAAIESLTAELSQAQESGAVEIPDSVPGKYATTRQLLYALDQAEINYTYDGIDSDGDEYIIIKDTCAGHPVTFRLWFSPDCEQANLRVWDIISFTSQQKNDVRIACDELNSSYKFAAFYLDYDSTITMSMDFILREDGKAGSIMLEGLMLAYSILEDAYPTLEACGK